MDFSLNDEQTAIDQLAQQVFEGTAAADPPQGAIDRTLWDSLAETGLLATTVAAEHDGLGLGVIEASLVCRHNGRAASPLPLTDHFVVSRLRPKPSLIDGSVIETIAIDSVALQTQQGAEQALLAGDVVGVRFPDDASAWWLPIDHGDHAGFAVVPADAHQLGLALSETTNLELQAHGAIELGIDQAELVGDAAAVQEARAVHSVLEAAYVLGACERAIERTVEHGNAREQFGRPLASNQAYSQRLADAAIEVDALRVTILQAAWQLDHSDDLAHAAEAVLIARWFAADAGSRIVHTTQHLHGSAGADISNPLHRHFLDVQQRAYASAAPTQLLAELGAKIAAPL